VDSVTATFSGMGPETVDVFEYEDVPVKITGGEFRGRTRGDQVTVPGDF
jgi:hypothetical protein